MFEGNSLKPGRSEKNDFLLAAIADLDNELKPCSEAIDKLKATHDRLEKATKGLPMQKTGLAQRKRRNAAKDARKKQERLTCRIEGLLEKLNAVADDAVINVVEETFVSNLHNNMTELHLKYWFRRKSLGAMP